MTEAEDQQPRNHLLYRALIGGGILAIVILLRRAMLKLNYKLTATRENFWPFLRTLLWMGLIGVILIASIVLGINLIAKRGEKKKPPHPHEDTF